MGLVPDSNSAVIAKPDPLRPMAGDDLLFARMRDDPAAVRNLLIFLVSISATPNTRVAAIAKESSDAIRVLYNELC